MLNADEFPENTPENAEEYIYLSEVLTQFAQEQGSKLPMHDVSKSLNADIRNKLSPLSNLIAMLEDDAPQGLDK